MELVLKNLIKEKEEWIDLHQQRTKIYNRNSKLLYIFKIVFFSLISLSIYIHANLIEEALILSYNIFLQGFSYFV